MFVYFSFLRGVLMAFSADGGLDSLPDRIRLYLRIQSFGTNGRRHSRLPEEYV